jgi:hypothetical protein
MPVVKSNFQHPPLRTVVRSAANQDLRHCQNCWICDEARASDQDISLGMLVQMVLLNDDEVLTSRTLWSDEMLAAARHACINGIHLDVVMLALRDEAKRRDQIEAEVNQNEVSD